MLKPLRKWQLKQLFRLNREVFYWEQSRKVQHIDRVCKNVLKKWVYKLTVPQAVHVYAYLEHCKCPGVVNVDFERQYPLPESESRILRRLCGGLAGIIMSFYMACEPVVRNFAPIGVFYSLVRSTGTKTYPYDEAAFNGEYGYSQPALAFCDMELRELQTHMPYQTAYAERGDADASMRGPEDPATEPSSDGEEEDPCSESSTDVSDSSCPTETDGDNYSDSGSNRHGTE